MKNAWPIPPLPRIQMKMTAYELDLTSYESVINFVNQAKGVNITVIGIGPRPKQYEKEMKELAGAEGKLFLVANFEALECYIEDLTKATCGKSLRKASLDFG